MVALHIPKKYDVYLPVETNDADLISGEIEFFAQLLFPHINGMTENRAKRIEQIQSLKHVANV